MDSRLGTLIPATLKLKLSLNPKWEFPKIRGTLLGVPIIRIIVFWGLYLGPLILGNYQIKKLQGINGLNASTSAAVGMLAVVFSSSYMRWG